ncbi:Reticulocyte-binding protein 2-like protein a [Bienertia sinuspersici]
MKFYPLGPLYCRGEARDHRLVRLTILSGFAASPCRSIDRGLLLLSRYGVVCVFGAFVCVVSRDLVPTMHGGMVMLHGILKFFGEALFLPRCLEECMANMLKFESNKTSDGLFLTVKDDNDGEKTLIIPIFSPMTGAFADKWKIDHYPPHLKKWVSGKSPKAILNSSHHHEKDTTKPLNLLYGRISRREVTWSSKPQFGVTFLHIPLYWEWTEDIRRCKTTLTKTDLIGAVYASMFLYKCNSPLMQRFCDFWCPTTNIVLTGDGEASISLWDLRILGGLPIYGAFYDEVVPTSLELEGSQDGKQFLPPSCKYMFTALQSIMSTSGAEAKVFIRSGQDINWIGNYMRNPKDRLLIDDSTLRQDVDFLLSIRSCFLTLRYDNDHVVEPYSPHRFSHQFGFCQNIPGVLKPDSEEPSLQYLWSRFQTSTQVGTKSSFMIPASVDNDNDTKADLSDKGESKLQKSSSQSSREPSPQQGKEGQEKASSQFLDERTIFHDIFGEDDAKLREKQKNDQAEDDFDYVMELEIMGNAFASNKPNAKELEHTTASIDPNVLVAASDPVAMYAAATIIARAHFLAQQMRARLLQTPLSNIPALDPKLKELFGYITSKNIDVTSLREHVEVYVSHANVESRLSDVVNLKRMEEEQIKLQQAEILKIEQRRDELQKELKLLERKKSELSPALATSEDSLGKHDAAVTELTMSHSSIEEEIAATREATIKRKKAEENFQSARTTLESLHWEP